MPISDLIEKGEVFQCNPSTPVREAAKMMDENNVGSLLVVENERPVGIITDRDIALRCFADGRDTSGAAIGDIMTRSVECVQKDDGVQDVLRVMKERHVRRLPVVDSDGKAIGLLSSDDLLRLLAKEMEDLTEAITPQAMPKSGGTGLKSA